MKFDKEEYIKFMGERPKIEIDHSDLRDVSEIGERKMVFIYHDELEAFMKEANEFLMTRGVSLRWQTKREYSGIYLQVHDDDPSSWGQGEVCEVNVQTLAKIGEEK